MTVMLLNDWQRLLENKYVNSLDHMIRGEEMRLKKSIIIILSIITTFIVSLTSCSVVYAQDQTEQIISRQDSEAIDVSEDDAPDSDEDITASRTDNFKYVMDANGYYKVPANDADAIQEILNYNKQNSSLRLKIKIPSGTYRLNKGLVAYSNTEILADEDAVIKRCYSGSASVLKTYRSPTVGGYSSCHKVTIDGGVWDGNYSEYPVAADSIINVITILHANTITVKNAVLRNSYAGHLLTFEAVKNGTASNCTFYGYKSQDGVRKEAIQLDIAHSKGMVGSNVVYDDTADDGITVENCTFHDYSRGVGSHATVEGVYHTNVIIRNNKFYNIIDEAVKTINYNNISVYNNTFSNCGEGIKIYNKESANDGEDGSGWSAALSTTTTTKVAGDNYNIKVYSNTLNNITGNCIQIRGTQNLPIAKALVCKNTITTTTDYGIKGSFLMAAKIYKNSVYDAAKYGISLNTCTSSTLVYSNTVDKSGSNGIGIDQESSNNKIYNNTIINSKKHGIALYKKSLNNIINNNTIDNVKQNGIAVYDTSVNNVITDNTISDCDKNGVIVDSSAPVTVSSNKISDIAKHGIAIYNSTYKYTFLKNNISFCKGNGINVSQASNGTIYKNSMNSINNIGIYCYDDSKACLIESNKIVSAKSVGIKINDCGKTTINKNSVSKTSGKGINIESTTADITNNSVKDNKDIGIFLAQSSNSKITTNKVYDNTSYGIYIANNSKSVKVSSNKVKNQKKSAIAFSDSDRGNISSNTIVTENTSSYGIQINGSNKIKTGKNIISGKCAGIIFVSGESQQCNVEYENIPNISKITDKSKNAAGEFVPKSTITFKCGSKNYKCIVNKKGKFTTEKFRPKLNANLKIDITVTDNAMNVYKYSINVAKK